MISAGVATIVAGLIFSAWARDQGKGDEKAENRKESPAPSRLPKG